VILNRGGKLQQLQTVNRENIEGEYVEIRLVPLSEIEKLDGILWEKNSKKHDIDKILESIERYGFQDAGKWDKNLNGGKGGIVFGNGRTEALITGLIAAREAGREAGREPPRGIPIDKTTGEWCIPMKFGVDCAGEVEAMALAIDHNNLQMSGFEASEISRLWESEGYLAVLSEIAEAGVVPVTVDEDAIADMLLAIGAEDEPVELGEDDLDAVLDAAEADDYEIRVKAGEIWRLGRHYIAAGDCTSKENIKQLQAVSGCRGIEMVWADPPYGISIVATNGYIGGGEANNIPFGGVKGETPEQKQKRMGYVGGGNCRRTTIAENAAKKERLGSIGGAKPFGSADVRGSVGASNVVKVNKYHPIAGDDLIDVAVLATEVYLSLFEKSVQCWWGGNYYANSLPNTNCWIVWDKENTGNFADAELAWTNQSTAVRIFKHMWNGMVKASEHGQKRVHPTQKPVKLFTWFAEKYGKSGDVIIDPFLGSGMSLIGAEQMGDRMIIGFELSEHYCSIILDRWEALTGQTAQLVGNL
jgi:DNA methylase